MSKFERTTRGEAVSSKPLPRPQRRHRQPDAQASRETDAIDPHGAWLKAWRTLLSETGDHGDAETRRAMVRELQEKIAHTPAATLAGLRAQAELISELAWNDLVAATARQLLAGIKRLQRSDGR